MAFGTYPPNLSATSAGIGAVQYGRPGSMFVTIGLDPGHVGAWNFPAYDYLGGGVVDYAGSMASNVLRCVVEGPGIVTIHTASYPPGAAATLTAVLKYFNGSIDVTEETQSGIGTGTDIVFTIPDDGHVHAIDVTDTGPGATKWGFASFDFEPLPSAGVYADWDGDGFGIPGSDDDITSDVVSWTVTRGAAAEITGGAEPGTAVVVLLNRPADDRYNPLNPAGPLYGKLRDGVPLWIGVNADGAQTGSDPRGQFGGRVKDITPATDRGADIAPQVEITCEDALGWLGRTPARLADAMYRSQGSIRAGLLAAAGETRVDLPYEPSTVPISSWDGSALAGLAALNGANGTRHFIRPADDRDLLYDYVARNRQWRLDGTVDAAISDASAIFSTDGWRLSADTVINQVKASVVPISFTSGQVTVWEAPSLPITVTSTTPYETWVAFDDYVDDPTVDINYTGTAPAVTLLAFGATAQLLIASSGSTSVTGLSIEGALLRRGVAESVVADDLTSQGGPRGVRAGSELSGDFVGVIANARGIASHVVWRYGSSQYRPTMTVEYLLPQMLELNLYDVVSVTVAQLGMTARHFEIVGQTVTWAREMPLPSLDYVLQECRVQSDPGWFVLDASLLDSAHKLAY